MIRTFDDLVPSAPPGRFDGIRRPYPPEAVQRLRGSLTVARSLAERGANKLWAAPPREPFVHALGTRPATRPCSRSARGRDAESAQLIASDADERDHPFIDRGNRSPEGFFRLREGTGLDHCIARSLACAEVADLPWWETSHPDLDDARRFAEAVHAKHPGKPLAHNCFPSFDWRAKLDEATIAKFQRELGAMGYRFQFVTLAGFHALSLSMFDIANGCRDRDMAAYSELQEREFATAERGFTGMRHQRQVGTGCFDQVAMTITGDQASTTAMAQPTEAAQSRPLTHSSSPACPEPVVLRQHRGRGRGVRETGVGQERDVGVSRRLNGRTVLADVDPHLGAGDQDRAVHAGTRRGEAFGPVVVGDPDLDAQRAQLGRHGFEQLAQDRLAELAVGGGDQRTHGKGDMEGS